MERHAVGSHTFQPCTADPLAQSDNVMGNRQLQIDFCIANQMQLSNTKFEQPDSKLATYMAVGVDQCQEIRRGTHEQIYFIIVAHRWKKLSTQRIK